MANDSSTVAFIVDQLSGAGTVSARAMFGEHGVYCDRKMVAMICNGQLFVKPTAGRRAFAGDVDEASPYPGAKPCLLVDPERLDDRDWMAQLVAITAVELLTPKAKATPRRKPR